MPEYCEGIRSLTPNDLIQINERLIRMKTPGEQSGVFSFDALHRAQQAPNMYRAYENTDDIITLASVLFVSIAKNHPFFNANKRTAVVATSMFLLINGYELTAPGSDLVEVAVGIVTDEIDRDYLERFLWKWHHPLADLSLQGTDALRRLIDRMVDRML